MENNIFLEELISRYPELLPVENEIRKTAECLIMCYQQGRKVLVCGNGGSCSDSDHIVGELMKGFEHKRPIGEPLKKQLSAFAGERGIYLSEKLQQGLPAISLTAHSALITAVANDTDADLVFAQQVVGYGNEGDVLIAISSSGNSQNVVDAIITAKAKGMVVIGLTGETGGKMKSFCDILINVPGRRTAFVQELHLPVYHTLCLMVENSFFGNQHC
ncbi:MAG: SIS domain-containing protein [Bacteroidales bacterium]|nr:SIS domain-containing protein [Bacteroidales bacterium]MDP3002538.1 SIS domain-containing protein [Bacteroidales bacterium]